MDRIYRGVRAAQWGVLINAALAVSKLLAGIVGNSYALIADAVESATDIFSSLIVMGGLQIARRDPDDEYPFGYGRAETLATAVVALILIGVAIGIAIEALREIRTPHHLPATWTLAVLPIIVLVKWYISRKVMSVAKEIGSTAVQADAWHHLSDAVTSLAAFVGIAIAVWGGPGWEAADDWAALVAVAIIAYNGFVILAPALRDLMDAHPGQGIVQQIREVARAVPGVLAVEKVFVRRAGIALHIMIHVQSEASISLVEAHAIGGRVKAELLAQVPNVQGVLVHMEPFQSPS